MVKCNGKNSYHKDVCHGIKCNIHRATEKLRFSSRLPTTKIGWLTVGITCLLMVASTASCGVGVRLIPFTPQMFNFHSLILNFSLCQGYRSCTVRHTHQTETWLCTNMG